MSTVSWHCQQNIKEGEHEMRNGHLFIYLYSAMFTWTSLKNLSSEFITTNTRTRSRETPWWSEAPVSSGVKFLPQSSRTARMNCEAEAIPTITGFLSATPIYHINRKPKVVWPRVRIWEGQGCFLRAQETLWVENLLAILYKRLNTDVSGCTYFLRFYSLCIFTDNILKT